MRDELFPNWGLQLVGEWYWVKICSTGELVFPLNSPHKKPFERILIGRFGKRAAPASRGKGGASGGGGGADSTSAASARTTFPSERVLLSIPCLQHSRKPTLGAVLAPYLPDNYTGLELFARNLLPGWTSFGNEVLKFNQLCSNGLSFS